MEAESDSLAIIVARSQEKLGALDKTIEAMHRRQDKMEGQIQETMEKVLFEMKDLSKKMDAEVKIINSKFEPVNAYINRALGEKAMLIAIASVIGGLIGKFLLK